MSNNNNDNNIVGLVIENKYKVLSFINKGTYGRIYVGKDITNGRKVAIKLEIKSLIVSHLANEYRILKKLGAGQDTTPHKSIAQIYFFGTIDIKWQTMVMQLLGPNIDQVMKTVGGTFSLKTTLLLAIQIIDAFMYVHDHNYIHRDIKPQNLMFGLPATDKYNVVHLIDFGLAIAYRRGDPLQGYEHIKPGESDDNRVGTQRFMSISGHKCLEQSRRDDMESVGYVLIYLLTGLLPWTGINHKDKDIRNNQILRIKETTTAETLCLGLPAEFNHYLNDIKNLEFTDKPNYDRYISMFRRKLGKILKPTGRQNYDFDIFHCKRQTNISIKDKKIGFLGAGKTADAIISGLIQYGKVDPKRIHVSAKTTKNLETIKQKGCHITKRNYDIFGKYDCDIVFLCFHGSVIKECYKIGGSRPHPLTTNFIPTMKHPLYVLSLVSGIKLDQIRDCLLNPEHPDKYMIEMHRLSISTACAYGLGITAIASKKFSPLIRDMLSTISKLEYIPESQMDSACALGGNGLAFVYYFINSLADGAFKMGLNRQMSIKLAAKTVQCAALTLLKSGKHPSELKDSCISPSGPVIYGIHVLDKADFASGVAGAVEAAHKRAKELAEKISN